MKWIVFTGEVVAPPSHDLDRPGLDGALWVIRPFYNDENRKRKLEYVGLKLPHIPPGQVSVTKDGVTVTLDNAKVSNTSIYSQTNTQYIEMLRKQHVSAPDISTPLHEDTATYLVEATDIPSDHPCGLRCKLRNAWEWTGQVTVNMPYARELRDTEFKRIKVREILKAQALADDAEVARLKAITFDVSRFTDPGALEMAWPDGLPKS